MASTLPSPPASRSSSPKPTNRNLDAKDSVQRLDALLEQYLELLDEYTSLREQLSSTFSDGFMSLAHAQRTSNLGPGRRYGQDGYDGRMKASKRVSLEPQFAENTSSSGIDSEKTESSVHDTLTHQVGPSLRIFEFKQHLRSGSIVEEKIPSPSETKKYEFGQTRLQTKDNHTSDPSKDTPLAQSKSKIDPAYRDPVTWYGILVPGALRQAQKSFARSVDDILPSLISTTRSLQKKESEIRSLRTEIGANPNPDSGNSSSIVTRSVS